MILRTLQLALSVTLVNVANAQVECNFFTEYKNEIKVWALLKIDSLQRQDIDTILFYGVGIGESGWVAYGKIIWANKGILNKVEITAKYVDWVVQLTPEKYDTVRDYQLIDFYSDYRLDTVTTLPKELHWQSHDFLHYVYSTIDGKEDCFIVPEYLLRDFEHLRSRWIRILSDNVQPSELNR